MSSAEGYIKCTHNGRFTATFVIDEITYNFSGAFANSVQAFTCNNATLEYASLNSITSTRSFEGRVGSSKVTLNLMNGPKIEGVLDIPIHPASTVSGSGVWTQN